MTLDYTRFLVAVLPDEWQGRQVRGIEARLRHARLPWVKTLDHYDFEFQPSLDRKQVRALASMSCVERGQPVVLPGPPGVGKTHLAMGLAGKAAEVGSSVRCLPLESLMPTLMRAKHENRLERAVQQLRYPKVLVLDELGYLPRSRAAASLFFRLVGRRYERASLIVPSNKGVLAWGEVFNDHVLATAILDRLLQHATTFNSKGES